MRHIHIIGIGGTFMDGVATIAEEAGLKVGGCDAKMYPPMNIQLEALGVDVHEGLDAARLDKSKADVYIIGNVAKRGMGVVEAILNRGLPYISDPQWLSENVLHHRWVLSVARTYSKMTTMSMFTWVLEYAGFAPDFLIGGVPGSFSVSARLPQTPRQDPNSKSSFFIIETGEYDIVFFDKRSRFVHYRPRIAVSNDLGSDHTDVFVDLDAIRTQFHHLVRTVPSEGLIVCNGQQRSLQGTLDRGCWTPVEESGTKHGWQVGGVNADGSFDILLDGKKAGHIAWDLIGGHNRMNALAVIAAARHARADIQTACEALSAFKNVKRRVEIKGAVNGITICDDFTHHPTAIEAIIGGPRRRVENAHILAVLEPRFNTMRLDTIKATLPGSLKGADQVFCYAGGTGQGVAEALAPLDDELRVGQDFDAFVVKIVKNAEAGDHILVTSNGGFGGIHGKLLEALQ